MRLECTGVMIDTYCEFSLPPFLFFSWCPQYIGRTDVTKKAFLSSAPLVLCICIHGHDKSISGKEREPEVLQCRRHSISGKESKWITHGRGIQRKFTLYKQIMATNRQGHVCDRLTRTMVYGKQLRAHSEILRGCVFLELFILCRLIQDSEDNL